MEVIRLLLLVFGIANSRFIENTETSMTYQPVLKSIKSERRRDRIARNLERANKEWLKRIKRTLIEQQMTELQKMKGQNQFFSTAANQTLHTVNNLSDRLVRDESRFNGELSQLNGRTESLESRLDQIQSQLTDELHKRSVYDSSMSYINDYKSDEDENNQAVLEALENKISSMEKYIQASWDTTQRNYKLTSENKSIFNKLQDEIRRLDGTLNSILENQNRS